MTPRSPAALFLRLSPTGLMALLGALVLTLLLPRLTSLTGQVNTSPPVDRYPPEQAHDGVVLRSGRYSLLAGEGQGSFPVVASTFATDPSARFWGYEPTGQEPERQAQGLPPDQIWNGKYFISAALQSGYPWYSNPQYASRIFTAMQQRHWYYVKVEDATTDLFFRTGQGVMGRAYDASCGTTIPSVSQIAPGQTFHITVSMRNDGHFPWPANGPFELSFQSPLWRTGPSSRPVSIETFPFGSAQFSLTVAAPSDPGAYTISWRMWMQRAGQSPLTFGAVCSSSFTVTALPTAAVCGNGRVEGNEPCDDGNIIAWDGCASDCTVEAGFTCTRPPNAPSQPPQPGVCTPLLPDLTGVPSAGSSSSPSPVQSSSSRSSSSSRPTSSSPATACFDSDLTDPMTAGHVLQWGVVVTGDRCDSNPLAAEFVRERVCRDDRQAEDFEYCPLGTQCMPVTITVNGLDYPSARCQPIYGWRPPANPICRETDNGFNISQAGSLTFQTYTDPDVCGLPDPVTGISTVLQETYCAIDNAVLSSPSTRATRAQVRCPTGTTCIGGACLAG